MRKFIDDLCIEFGAAVERALCDWSSSVTFRYEVKSGVVVVTMDSNDDFDVTIIHHNGKTRKDDNIKQAICNNTSSWQDYRDSLYC